MTRSLFFKIIEEDGLTERLEDGKVREFTHEIPLHPRRKGQPLRLKKHMEKKFERL